MLFKPGFIGIGNLPLELRLEVDLSQPTTSAATVSNVNVGDPFNTRRIVYVIAGESSGAGTTGVTIGGITATKVVEAINTLGGTQWTQSQIWVANVPQGETVDIVKSGSGSGPKVHRVYVLAGGDGNIATYVAPRSLATPPVWTFSNVVIPATSFTVSACAFLTQVNNDGSLIVPLNWVNNTHKEYAYTQFVQSGVVTSRGGDIASRFDTVSDGTKNITATGRVSHISSFFNGGVTAVFT